MADLNRLLEGDKRAWDRFVADHAAVIYAAVRRKLAPSGRLDEAEDVAQDVFVKLCRNDFKVLRSFDPERAKLTTFLTVIATTTTIDHLRKTRPEQGGLGRHSRGPAARPPGLDHQTALHAGDGGGGSRQSAGDRAANGALAPPQGADPPERAFRQGIGMGGEGPMTAPYVLDFRGMTPCRVPYNGTGSYKR